ncbi:hypothetical protein SmJEL517_g00347 [Synchytrium microbalum]|uniref:Uncharacterized protein n=1 Tax=Synchytrium microbalum TaxID=1806994 RepID=A0A507C9V4_9FUNG|nr:uncharacterized protein SmJEL517_g00347 [Synchytrium microbalum]TPX38360.1 hypothetical protein SmJEL517_g00347 [Synchytrium microbalum]
MSSSKTSSGSGSGSRSSKPSSSSASQPTKKDPPVGWEFSAHPRYRNPLPELPFDPKLIPPKLGLERHYKFRPDEQTPMDGDFTIGVNVVDDLVGESLNLADMGVLERIVKRDPFIVRPSATQHPLDLDIIKGNIDAIPLVQLAKPASRNPDTPISRNVGPSGERDVAWLRRTTYIASEAVKPRSKKAAASAVTTHKKMTDVLGQSLVDDMSIENQIRIIMSTFRSVDEGLDNLDKLEHPTKKGVTAEEAVPVFPDFETWGTNYTIIHFDEDPFPAPITNEQAQVALEESILAIADTGSGEYASLFKPTDETARKMLGKRKRGEDFGDDPNTVYDYDNIRDYDFQLTTFDYNPTDKPAPKSRTVDFTNDKFKRLSLSIRDVAETRAAFYYVFENIVTFKRRRLVGRHRSNDRVKHIQVRPRPLSAQEVEEKRARLMKVLADANLVGELMAEDDEEQKALQAELEANGGGGAAENGVGHHDGNVDQKQEGMDVDDVTTTARAAMQEVLPFHSIRFAFFSPLNKLANMMEIESTNGSISSTPLPTSIAPILNISPETSPHELRDALIKIIPQNNEERIALAGSDAFLSFLRQTLEIAAQKQANSTDLVYKEMGAAAAKLLAEIAKAEEARQHIGESGNIPALLSLQRWSSRNLTDINDEREDGQYDEVIVQTLRALANLCFDNETNREIVLDTKDSINNIVRCLNSRSSQLLNIVCGALLNISMENEPVQVEILNAGGLTLLLNVIKLGTDVSTRRSFRGIGPVAIKVLSNLVEAGKLSIGVSTQSSFRLSHFATEKGAQELMSSGGLSQMLRLLWQQHQNLLDPEIDREDYDEALELLDVLTTVLETIGENDQIQRAIVDKDLLDILLDFVDHRPPARARASGNDETLMKAVTTYTDIRRTVSRIVTLVTMNDANMVDMPKKAEIINRFKRWMTLVRQVSVDDDDDDEDQEDEDEEVRMSGALCLGNLARSDETCATLVKTHNVVPALVKLLRLETERLRMAQTGEDTKMGLKVVHAVIGALKNLSLASADRTIMGDLGVINAVAGVFDLENIKPVQYGCVGIIKNLCGGQNEANVYRTIGGVDPPPPTNDFKLETAEVPIVPGIKTPLARIISLIWRATGDSDTGIRNEGGRVIVNLTRSSHRARAPQFIKAIVDSNGIPPLIQILTGALLTRDLPPDAMSEDSTDEEVHVHFDALPSADQVFPLVQNEGLVALSLIATSVPSSIPIITKYSASLIPTLIRILQSGLPEFAEHTQPKESKPSRNSGHFKDDVGGDKEHTVYSDETKCNVCTLADTLIKRDAAFKARISEDLKTTLPALLKVVKASPSASSAENPISPTTSIHTTAEYSKRGTVGSGGGQPTQKELQRQLGGGLGRAMSVVDIAMSLENAANSLLGNI